MLNAPKIPVKAHRVLSHMLAPAAVSFVSPPASEVGKQAQSCIGVFPSSDFHHLLPQKTTKSNNSALVGMEGSLLSVSVLPREKKRQSSV